MTFFLGGRGDGTSSTCSAILFCTTGLGAGADCGGGLAFFGIGVGAGDGAGDCEEDAAGLGLEEDPSAFCNFANRFKRICNRRSNS